MEKWEIWIVDILRNEVEKKRKELNELAKQYGLADERVLLKSRELDNLLNRYSVH